VTDTESSNHQRFEELCALAALGEISSEQFVQFREHIETCASCRVEYEEYVETIDNYLPAASPRQAAWRGVNLRELAKGHRQRFLARARAQGFQFTPEVEAEPSRWRIFGGWLSPYPNSTRVGVALATVLMVAVAVLGYKLHQSERLSGARDADVARLAAQNAVLQRELPLRSGVMTPTSASKDRSDLANPASRVQSARALGDYKTKLARSKALEDQLAEATSRISALEEQVTTRSNDESEMAQKLDQAQATVNQTTEELRRLRESRAEDAAVMAAQEARLSELSSKLAEQVDTIERDKKLLAVDHDIRDLMSARNLHIIDVFDVDGHGKTRRPFGRAFYTESKSLIFYAFDLAPQRPSRTAHSFQAWGYRESARQSAQSLGVFYADDKSQNRWVLKFDDPDVLAQIDAVFVTVEPPGGSSEPTGQKLLYAYLKGQPNHP